MQRPALSTKTMRIQESPMDQTAPAAPAKPPVVVTLTVPLCPSRCGFCDLPIACGEASSASNREAYARALMAEIDAAALDLASYEVAAIRIAGGAANHLGGAVLSQLVGFLSNHATVTNNCEVSLSCVPTGLNIGIFEQLQRRWNLRLEIEYGTSEAFLHQRLERWFPVGAVHDAAAVARARRTSNFDLNVLYGLEGQGIPSLRASIDTAARLGATHITLKPLRLTPGTTVEAAYRRFLDEKPSSPRRIFPSESKQRELYTAGVERLKELGYERYTQHHFALPGFRARHLELACSGAAAMGFGAGASSRYGGVTCSNTTNLARYLEKSGDFRAILESSAMVEAEDEERERFVLGLYATKGLATTSLPTFPNRDGLIAALETRGWLERAHNRIRLTHEGGFAWEQVCAQIRQS